MPIWGDGAKDPVEVCHPIGVEVYKVDESLLEGWQEPQFAQYAGRHGLRANTWPEHAAAQ